MQKAEKAMREICKAIGKELRQMREDRHIKQITLAKQLGISPSHMFEIEDGSVILDEKRLKQIYEQIKGERRRTQDNRKHDNRAMSRSSPSFCSAQRTRDMENLRITIKILERQDREIELQTARFFLREIKNKNRQPLAPNDLSSPATVGGKEHDGH